MRRVMTAAVVTVAMIAPAAHAATQPTALAMPSLRHGGQLTSVSCPTDTDCVAVGVSGKWPLVERFDGTRWRVQPSAALPGLRGAHLSSVSCASASACVALGVGYGRRATTSLMERFDGHRWRRDAHAILAAVGFEASPLSCPTAAECFGVPAHSKPGAVDRWNGHGWRASLPGGPHVAIASVSCATATFCLAVGEDDEYDGLVERFDGRGWHRVSAPADASLSGVSCPVVTFCLLTGATTDGDAPDGVAARWDGTKLRTVTPFTPQPGAYALFATSCASATQCLVLGGFGAADPTEEYGTTWNGTGLGAGFTEPGSDSHPWAATACRPSFCLLVGSRSGRPASARYVETASPAA